MILHYIIFQLVFHCRLLQDIERAPRAIQWVLVVYLFYIHWGVSANPNT